MVVGAPLLLDLVVRVDPQTPGSVQYLADLRSPCFPTSWRFSAARSRLASDSSHSQVGRIATIPHDTKEKTLLTLDYPCSICIPRITDFYTQTRWPLGEYHFQADFLEETQNTGLIGRPVVSVHITKKVVPPPPPTRRFHFGTARRVPSNKDAKSRPTVQHTTDLPHAKSRRQGS